MKDVLFSTGPTKTWSEREKVFFFFIGGVGGWGGVESDKFRKWSYSLIDLYEPQVHTVQH